MKKLIFLTTLLLLCSLGFSQSQNCPTNLQGFTFLGEFNDHHYFLSDETRKPAIAQVIAVQNGGNLVSIKLQIFDARGLLVKTEKVALHDGDNTVDIFINELPGGFYFLKIPQAQINHSMMRFVKVRD